MIQKTTQIVAAFLLVTLTQLAWANPDFTDLVERSVPAVVNIDTTQFGTRPGEASSDDRQLPDGLPDLFRHFFDQPPGDRGRPDRHSGGSGFIIDRKSTRLNSSHVAS